VPADALLAPAYEQMPAEQSLLAGGLAEALGAPDTGARDDGPGKGDPLGIQRVRPGLSRTAARGQPAVAGSRVPRWDWGRPGPPEAAGRAEDETTGEQNVALPGPGQPVGFDAHIRPLFREKDRQSMSFAADLGSYNDVRAHADGILARLADGSMALRRLLAADKTDVFRRWTQAGMQP